MDRKKIIGKAKRIVIKLGTNVVIKDFRFNKAFVNDLAKEISFLRRDGKEIILVSSGAIGLGLEKLRLNKSDLSIALQQATASVGQSLLMHEFEKIFSRYNQTIAQILLTQDNFSNGKSLENLKHNLNKVIALNVVPVINENDAIAVEELASKKEFSDNDILAALVASKLGADLLIILTNVKGLFDSDPVKNKNAKLVPEVSDLSELKVLIGGKSYLGRGGFHSKLKAGEIVLKENIPLIVAEGRKKILQNIFEGKETGTIFWNEKNG